MSRALTFSEQDALDIRLALAVAADARLVDLMIEQGLTSTNASAFTERCIHLLERIQREDG